MTNIEFKARVSDFDCVREALLRRGARFAGVWQQVDAYFQVPHGRLKLRETRSATPELGDNGFHSQLIFYRRADAPAVKRSDYDLVDLQRADGLRELLTEALGMRQVIKKNRELYLLGYEGLTAEQDKIHIRVHLDRVEELGEFVEVEALVGRGVPAAQAEQEARGLFVEFGIRAEDLQAGSYSDLLSEKRAEYEIPLFFKSDFSP